MDELELFQRLGVALAIGLLFGLERGRHQRDQREGGRIAGLRTFALAGLLGGVNGWLASLTAPVVLALAFLGLSVLLGVSYWLRLKEDDDVGLTTEIAFLLAFSLGAASVLGNMPAAAAVAVIAAVMLSMKKPLHRWVSRIKRLELEAVLKLGLLSVVILPLLPNQGYGPGAALNPYQIWWAVVLVAGLSFFGYAAIRLGGASLGPLVTGLFGGLASSTSTTLALSRLVRLQTDLVQHAAAGIVIAGSVTFLRILVLVAVFQPSLVAPLAIPMGVMAGFGFAGAAVLWFPTRHAEEGQGPLEELDNPLELSAALAFGALLSLILLAVQTLRDWMGSTGVYAGAALSGVTDVDALTISVSNLVADDLARTTGATAIFIAAAVNTVVKAGISFGVGGSALGLRVGPVYAAVIMAGAVSLWVLGWGI
ncbi:MULTISPECIES: MgtC/SapB family protein [Roseinatronobacter]|uniref:MgtC/SapB family protein n=1 Tax=Roseinatronobacter domitianus TaxID=2940293 RepID=A0ABT0LWY6_9RHOB|nr:MULTISPECIES: MgtC/SapB family protein [Roseibaca]MCL1627122.1 MgtC/SapB family protein [Roseibaca domitiana]